MITSTEIPNLMLVEDEYRKTIINVYSFIKNYKEEFNKTNGFIMKKLRMSNTSVSYALRILRRDGFIDDYYQKGLEANRRVRVIKILK